MHEPLCLIQMVELFEIAPISPLIHWEYPRMYHPDCNRITFHVKLFDFSQIACT